MSDETKFKMLFWSLMTLQILIWVGGAVVIFHFISKYW